MSKSSSPKPSYAHVQSHNHHHTILFEKPVIQYLILLSVIATLILSAFALANTYQLKKAVIPRTISVNDFLRKLTSHAEMKSYAGTAPLNIIQISSSNLANLQAQVAVLDASYIGKFIVQYPDRIAIYDYDNDKIMGNAAVQQAQSKLQNDLLSKLYRHPELQGLQSQQPAGGQLDAATLNTLKQQFPEVYANAKVGDFLLRYSTKLVIYDYNADKIVNDVNLG